VATDLSIDDQIELSLEAACMLTVRNGDLVEQLGLQGLPRRRCPRSQQMRQPQWVNIARQAQSSD